MTPLAQHIGCRLRNDGPIADTLEKRCLLSRAVLEIGRELDLLSFGAVDTHVTWEQATQAAQKLREILESLDAP
jgi:hypothetical protein